MRAMVRPKDDICGYGERSSRPTSTSSWRVSELPAEIQLTTAG
jgi:hypothetical protein